MRKMFCFMHIYIFPNHKIFWYVSNLGSLVWNCSSVSGYLPISELGILLLLFLQIIIQPFFFHVSGENITDTVPQIYYVSSIPNLFFNLSFIDSSFPLKSLELFHWSIWEFRKLFHDLVLPRLLASSTQMNFWFLIIPGDFFLSYSTCLLVLFGQQKNMFSISKGP